MARLTPADRIREVLRGDLIDIYIRHVPAFHGIGRDKVYDMVLSNPNLAAECYNLFSTQPSLFRHLLVDVDGRPVTSDQQRLSCGRSLQDVVALLVRAVAKRYFLGYFRPAAAVRPSEPSPGLKQRLLLLLGKSAQPRKARRKATKGDSLYRVLQHHLLYPWQLPLIPHYTALPIALLRQLGPRILEFRTSGSLQKLRQDGVVPPARALEPAFASAAGTSAPVIQVTLPGSKATVSQAKAEAMWTLAKGLRLAETFDVDEAEMRQIVQSASVTSGSVITSLSSRGLAMRSLVVLLCAFERRFGRTRMPGLFGPQAHPAFIEALLAQIDRQGIADLQHPGDIRNRVELVIQQMQRANQLPR